MKKSTKFLSYMLCVILAAAAFSGCSFFAKESISFTRSSINMVYGETLDLSPYIKIKNTDRGVYTLSATQSSQVVSVVTQSGIKAIGTGEAEITAKLSTGGSASIKVTVDFVEATSLTLFESGQLYQRTTAASNVIFTAVFSEGTNPATATNWYVDGNLQTESGTSLTLAPQKKAGAYTVKAEHAENSDLFDEKTVRVYDDYSAPTFDFEGQQVYDNPTAVSFGFAGEITEGNPEYLYEMYVNDQLYYSTHDYIPTITFSPLSAGIYTFTFKVNGETVRGADGDLSVRICFKGVVTPHGLSLDFASSYPKVNLSWLNREETIFTLVLAQGSKEEVINNIQVQQGHIDIGAYIDLTKNYTLKLKSEDFGEYFLGSDYVTFTHSALPAAALQYLSKGYLDSNFYMAGDDDIYAVFDYALVFRPGAVKSGDKSVSEVSMYMGYTSSMTTAAFEKQFENRMTITGNYWWSLQGMTAKGSVLKLSISFFNDNEPTNTSVAGKAVYRTMIAPKLGGGLESSTLPVDSFPLSKSTVSNTNELFYALERGVRPLIAAGSAAERVYARAREVLFGILSDGMSEERIAEAIYDWVIYAVSYDDNVTSGGISYAVLQPAYYPEGVFDTGFAVCDGISKSYSLLCNMMGIKCVRVVGTAGQTTTANHAWNKVLIGGRWYIVDATWGGGKVDINGRFYKAGTKDYFLLSDADTASTHFEMGFLYPKTAATGFNWFAKNGLYIYATQDLETQIIALVDKMLAAYDKDKKCTVLGETTSLDYCATEFKVAPGLLSAFRSMPNILTREIERRGVHNSSYDCIPLSDLTTIIIALR